jgi:hypothetical protein
LEMKKLKEEQATTEKILAWLEDGKDVRKYNWAPKEVCDFSYLSIYSIPKPFNDEQEP